MRMRTISYHVPTSYHFIRVPSAILPCHSFTRAILRSLLPFRNRGAEGHRTRHLCVIDEGRL